MTVKIKTNLTLPDEVSAAFESLRGCCTCTGPVRNAYMAVLRDKGWTLQSIATAFGGITRERVRQCASSIEINSAKMIVQNHTDTLPIPDVPLKPEKPTAPPRPMPTLETLNRLRELKPLAAQVRYAHKQNRDEAEEYVALLWHAHTVEGVSIYRLGKILGVLSCGLETRLVRYGYKETRGTSGSFTPVKHRKIIT